MSFTQCRSLQKFGLYCFLVNQSMQTNFASGVLISTSRMLSQP